MMAQYISLTGLSPSSVLRSSRFSYISYKFHHPLLEESGHGALQHLPTQRLPPFVIVHTQTPKCFHDYNNFTLEVWADPFSLAATGGVDFSFFSSGYLDGSVPLVSFSLGDKRV